MIVWLNEAVGEDHRIIQGEIAAMDERDTMQAEAKYARRVLPRDDLAKRLFQQGEG